MSEIGNLDPLKVTVTCANRYLTGFAPDGIFTLAWSSDRVSFTAGSQGGGVFVENADESAILTVTLSPTSSSIAHLDDLCNRRAEFPVTVNDASPDGRMTYSSERCRVQKFPDRGRSNSATALSYSIIMPKVKKIA